MYRIYLYLLSVINKAKSRFGTLVPKHLLFEMTRGDCIEVPISKNMARGILLYLQTYTIWIPCILFLGFKLVFISVPEDSPHGSHGLSRSDCVNIHVWVLQIWSKSRGHFWAIVALLGEFCFQKFLSMFGPHHNSYFFLTLIHVTIWDKLTLTSILNSWPLECKRGKGVIF